jgi:hypothetical protein
VIDFSEYFSRKDKQENDDLKERRNGKIQLVRQKSRRQEENQYKYTQRKVFIVLSQEAADCRQQHQNMQNQINNPDRFAVVMPVAVRQFLYIFTNTHSRTSASRNGSSPRARDAAQLAIVSFTGF